MNRFAPFRAHSSPFAVAVVARFAASLPASGSVRAHAPNVLLFARGTSYSRFCSSDAKSINVDSVSDVCTEIVVRTLENPRLISSTSRAKDT